MARYGGIRHDDITVVILGGGRGSRLEPLTHLRAKPAVPLAGKYRLIDVPISNAIHSGMERIFVLTQFNSVSLHRHLNAAYKFDPFSHGFVEVLAAQQTPTDDRWFQGTADAVRQNAYIVAEQPGDRVLILAGDHLYRFDYNLLLDEHLRSGADVTLAVLPCSRDEIGAFGAVRLDERGRVVAFREKPDTPEALEGMAVPGDLLARRGVDASRPYVASMGIYLFDKEFLIRSLGTAGDDFGRHVLPAAVDTHHVQACFFDGYWRDIGTIRAFYDAHMDLLVDDPPFAFHDEEWPIYTHARFLPGSRVVRTTMDQSIIADGASIRDSRVEHSIIGLRSCLEGVTLRHTLLMGVDEIVPPAPPGAPAIGIGSGSVIEGAIVDKNARIGRDVQLVNARGVDAAEGDGWVIRDGIIVLPKNTIVPDGTKI
jgi:glucose-1-phosphate adenylyltransferase